MSLRIISAILWFLAGWGVVGAIAINLGLSQALAPLVGLAWAALVMIDPKDVVWRVGKRRSPTVLRHTSDTPAQLDAAA